MASPLLALAKSPPPKSPAVSSKNHHCWSKLPLDLMLMVFEILSFADFERAKSVCSSWYSGSKQSKPHNQIPWMILFPKGKNHCLLFNPEDKEKLYKTQHLGDEFAKSICLTTCGSWLLMCDDYYWRDMEGGDEPGHGTDNLYIFNLLTRERFNLPAFQLEFELFSSILWIDEKTKDYLVIGIRGDSGGEGSFFFKKGDNSWKKIPQFPLEGLDRLCFHMVYKDHKLYCLSLEEFYIFDFSGEIPQQVFRISVCGVMPIVRDFKGETRLVVTVRGDVLIVRCIGPPKSKTWKFEIFKMGSSTENKWERIFTLGDESIIFDLGITVLAKDLKGITSNSIYFNGNSFFDKFTDEYYRENIFIFNLDTEKIERPLQFVCSSVLARWFLPSFKQE